MANDAERATVEFRLNGEMRRLDVESVTAAATRGVPDGIREHWVEAGGGRWPPKQLFEAATGIPRSKFTSHIALRLLQRIGFTTSDIPTASRPATVYPLNTAIAPEPVNVAAEAFRVLITFVSAEALTPRIARLESELNGRDQPGAEAIVTESGMTEGLVRAALLVRQHAGRMSDIIHAAAIVQTLPLILQAGERVANRPSLAAGNDPTRPFDLETNLRVAEFKLSVWKGSDAMRKRGVFADLVHLALDGTDRRKQLFVVGQEPIRFLTTSTSSAAWALNRASPMLRDRFRTSFGDLRMPVCEFTAGRAAHVDLMDITTLLPALADLGSEEQDDTPKRSQ
jgi:hypothetical protein